jgi:hypothetical protein
MIIICAWHEDCTTEALSPMTVPINSVRENVLLVQVIGVYRFKQTYYHTYILLRFIRLRNVIKLEVNIKVFAKYVRVDFGCALTKSHKPVCALRPLHEQHYSISEPCKSSFELIYTNGP